VQIVTLSDLHHVAKEKFQMGVASEPVGLVESFGGALTLRVDVDQ
jgi:hypothetical protein